MPNDLKPLANHLHTHGIGRQREAEILRELSEHVEDDVATLESQGLTNAEAARSRPCTTVASLAKTSWPLKWRRR